MLSHHEKMKASPAESIHLCSHALEEDDVKLPSDMLEEIDSGTDCAMGHHRSSSHNSSSILSDRSTTTTALRQSYGPTIRGIISDATSGNILPVPPPAGDSSNRPRACRSLSSASSVRTQTSTGASDSSTSFVTQPQPSDVRLQLSPAGAALSVAPTKKQLNRKVSTVNVALSTKSSVAAFTPNGDLLLDVPLDSLEKNVCFRRVLDAHHRRRNQKSPPVSAYVCPSYTVMHDGSLPPKCVAPSGQCVFLHPTRPLDQYTVVPVHMNVCVPTLETVGNRLPAGVSVPIYHASDKKEPMCTLDTAFLYATLGGLDAARHFSNTIETPNDDCNLATVKMQICSHFLDGMCLRGERCQFLHAVSALDSHGSYPVNLWTLLTTSIPKEKVEVQKQRVFKPSSSVAPTDRTAVATNVSNAAPSCPSGVPGVDSSQHSTRSSSSSQVSRRFGQPNATDGGASVSEVSRGYVPKTAGCHTRFSAHHGSGPPLPPRAVPANEMIVPAAGGAPYYPAAYSPDPPTIPFYPVYAGQQRAATHQLHQDTYVNVPPPTSMVMVMMPSTTPAPHHLPISYLIPKVPHQTHFVPHLAPGGVPLLCHSSINPAGGLHQQKLPVVHPKY